MMIDCNSIYTPVDTNDKLSAMDVPPFEDPTFVVD